MSLQRCLKDAEMDADRILAAMPLFLKYMRNEMDSHGPGYQFALGEIEECRKRLGHMEHLLRLAKQVGRG